MIITSTLGARMRVSSEVLVRGDSGAQEGIARELVKAVQREGEQVGAFVREESVWVHVSEVSERDFVTCVEALWSPDPAKGVFLLGGAADGSVVNLPREDDGRPIRRLTVPAGGETGMMSTWAEYDREGIDSERDVWVYRHKS